ncbi:MAG: hypothetical protein H7Z37_08020 [Pyrinomonadaceae bacterium]|nr:hypothetical protein [Pyrinomonadaceae bacterium]
MSEQKIKVIKRNAKVPIKAKNEKEIISVSLKALSRKKREITKTITSWIAESRENNRIAEIVARRLISGEPFTSKG